MRIAVIADTEWHAGEGVIDSTALATITEDQGEVTGLGIEVCRSLRQLEIDVSLVTKLGGDQTAERLIDRIDALAIDRSLSLVSSEEETTVSCNMVAATGQPWLTTLRRPGATLQHGDRLDITTIFAADAVILTIADERLIHFLVDLPAHTAPRVSLLGVVSDPGRESAQVDLVDVLRFDAVVASESGLCELMSRTDPLQAVDLLQSTMVGAGLRTVAMFGKRMNSAAFTGSAIWWANPGVAGRPIGPAGFAGFIAGAAVGVARRLPVAEIGALAVAAAGLDADLS